MRVDEMRNRKEKYTDSKVSGYVSGRGLRYVNKQLLDEVISRIIKISVGVGMETSAREGFFIIIFKKSTSS